MPRGRPKGSKNATPRGRKSAKFNPEALIEVVDVTPKIHIKPKRLSVAEAKTFHRYLGRLIAKLEGKKR